MNPQKRLRKIIAQVNELYKDDVASTVFVNRQNQAFVKTEEDFLRLYIQVLEFGVAMRGIETDYLSLGHAYEELADVLEPVENQYYNEAIKVYALCPESHMKYLSIGRCKFFQEELKTAKSNLEKSIAMEETSVAFHFLGRTHYDLAYQTENEEENLRNAEKYLLKSISIEEDPSDFFYLAQVQEDLYLISSDPTEKKEYLKSTINSYTKSLEESNDPDISQRIQELKEEFKRYLQ